MFVLKAIMFNALSACVIITLSRKRRMIVSYLRSPLPFSFACQRFQKILVWYEVIIRGTTMKTTYIAHLYFPVNLNMLEMRLCTELEPPLSYLNYSNIS